MPSEKVNEIIASYQTGRPVKLIPDDHTLTRLADMAMLSATDKEICGCLGVCENTFKKFREDYPEVQKIMDAAREEGKLSLRRTQWKMSETNAQVAIFLGKNLLNQSEKLSTENNLNVNVLKSLMDLTTDNTIDGEASIISDVSSNRLKDDSND